MSEHNFEAWCSQHQTHPKYCWEQHVMVHEYQGAESSEQQRKRIEATHVELQDKLVQCSYCEKYTRDIIEHESRRCLVLREARAKSKAETVRNNNDPGEAQH